MAPPAATDPTDPEADGHRFRSLNGRELLAIVGFWTFIALLSSANHILDPRGPGSRWADPMHPITLEFLEAYVWALITPLVFWLSGRVRMERSRWLGSAILLLLAGIAISVVVDVAEDLFEVHALGRAGAAAGMSPVQSLVRMWFLNDLMIYLALVATGFAREYFYRYRARQDEAVRLQARAAVLEAQLADARLEALRMQVNPHFLFNTLHAISTLVNRDPDGVRRMIAKLASLLRTTLQGGAQPEVPLERELEFLEDYLEIMQVRFQGRLAVEFDVDAGLLHARIPNLILQPLVENAVKHGVARTDEPVRITVGATSANGSLVLRVLDTGPGLNQDDEDGLDEGIGLRNVRERLSQLYGEDATLTVEARPEGGVCSQIRLPLRGDGAGSATDQADRSARLSAATPPRH